MNARVLVLAALGLAVASATAWAGSTPAPPSGVVAPRPGPGHPAPRGDEPPAKPHRPGELECRNCHEAKHQGVLRMYLGMGGRGTAMIPSHMVQVRVECVACHVVRKEPEPTAGLVGQTFKPSEQACVGCHGEKYRGMLDRWTATLAKMRDILTPKVTAARAALAAADVKAREHARARTLVEDADFNLRFVTLGKGVHNVFYAADLLKLSNGWLDEAVKLIGRARAPADDALVRGGYCAVLCHEQAGVRLPETVPFDKRRIPHARHITEFGAVCTACHSADVHKAVTAKADTCAACHHAPQNDRCETCHRVQSAFYRGQTRTAHGTVAPNLMAETVTCTSCHDWSAKHSRAAVGEKCLGCHEPPYAALMTEWTAGFDADLRKTAEAVRGAEAAIARARRSGRKAPEAAALVKDAKDALALVRTARPAHNPLAADALLATAREKAAAARAKANGR